MENDTSSAIAVTVAAPFGSKPTVVSNCRPSDDPAQPNLDVASTNTNWSLRFWLLTVLSGAAVGLAGGALMRLLQTVEHLAWDYDAGTLLDAAGRAPAARHVLVLLAAGILVGLGGTLIRKKFGRPGEAEAAIWFRSGRMPIVSTLAQSIHSIVIVGMGTSLGRESPIKQAGGAIASRMAQWGRLSRPEQRLFVACGVGAGMACAYNVPVGGALFAGEVLLGSISPRLALPALLCSGAATAVSWILLPTGPVYQVPEYPLSMQLTVWSLLAGPLLGLAAVPLVRAVDWAEAHKPRDVATSFVTPMVMFTVLAVVSMAFPQLLGNGKDAVQAAFTDGFSVSLLLVLPALKLLATCGCLGSGASGGLFTPTMTIGALVGGLLGHAWDRVWPGASMGSCSVIGSCAFLAAATQAPISALVIVLELTRRADATMVPMLLAVAGSPLVARQFESRSVYSLRLQLGPVPKPHSGAAQFDHLISRDFPAIHAAAGYAQVARQLLFSPFGPPLYVLDHEGQLVGAIDAESLQTARLGAMPIDAAKAADIATELRPLHSQMSEKEVLDRLAEVGDSELPVVDAATSRMIGVVVNKKPKVSITSPNTSSWNCRWAALPIRTGEEPS